MLDVEAGFELCHLLEAGVALRELIRIKDDRGLFAALRHRDRHDLLLETALVDGRDGLALAVIGELILLLAGDAHRLGDVLGGRAHVVAAVHVGRLGAELTLGEGVDEFHVAGADAPAGVADVENGVGHALGAAGEHDVGLAGHDLHGAVDDGGHAGGALAHDGVGGRLLGDADLQRGDAGDVRLVGGLTALAEDDLVDLFRIEAGALEGALEHAGGQIQRMEGLEGAAHAADGGAAAVHDDDFSDLTHRYSLRFFRPAGGRAACGP